MDHLQEIFTSPYFWVAFTLLSFYHYLPKKTWRPFEVVIQFLWSGVEKIDGWIFNPDGTKKKAKKTKFQKIVSPFGQVLLIILTFIIYISDIVFIKPATKRVNLILASERMAKIITWIESQHIIVLRLFVGIPFFFMEITGIVAALIATNIIVFVLIYATKVFWVIPFNMMQKIGHDKLDSDPWFIGLKNTAIRAIDAVKLLGAMKSMTNSYDKVKDFVTDSNYSTKNEIRIRKKIAGKVLKEIVSLHHLGDELTDSDEIDIIFFTPKATEMLNKYSENPEDKNLEKGMLHYIKTELAKRKQKEEKKKS